jgi:hypothetical protein
MKIEDIRKSYQPKKIKLLLIGESPPESGKFFYLESSMTTFTQRAFENTFKLSFKNHKEFLQFFKKKGCYLDDLSLIPVNGIPPLRKEEVLSGSILSLAKRLTFHKPEIVVIVLKRIERKVNEALDLSRIQCERYILPFPGNGHQNKYIQELSKILKSHML